MIQDNTTIPNETILIDLKNKMGFADINIRFFNLKPQLSGSGMASYKAFVRRKMVEQEIDALMGDIKKYNQLLMFADGMGILEDN